MPETRQDETRQVPVQFRVPNDVDGCEMMFENALNTDTPSRHDTNAVAVMAKNNGFGRTANVASSSPAYPENVTKSFILLILVFSTVGVSSSYFDERSEPVSA